VDTISRQVDIFRAFELRFQAVAQSLTEAVILADDQARIIFWNKGAEAMFAYQPEEILGYPLELLMPERYRDRYRLAFDEYRVTGKSRMIGSVLEGEGMRKDGTDFPLEISLASWRTGEGTFFAIVVRDLTERRRNEELSRSKEAAEVACRAKSCFIAKVNHELRAPLNAVIGFTRMLLTENNDNLTDRQTDFLERILINATDQLQLVNNVLDVSRMEAGRMDLNIGPVYVDKLIREAARQIDSRYRSSGVELTLTIPESLAPISTDGLKLKQVLINLLDNALKFTERGSVTVRVDASPMDRSPIFIHVIDTGPGIPSDCLQRIFEPFLQLKTTDASRFQGTGLGLTVSRSLCDLLGYTINVSSRTGEGSIFTVGMRSDASRLPLSA
jgi:PAS domain S-box-containing protein